MLRTKMMNHFNSSGLHAGASDRKKDQVLDYAFAHLLEHADFDDDNNMIESTYVQALGEEQSDENSEPSVETLRQEAKRRRGTNDGVWAGETARSSGSATTVEAAMSNALRLLAECREAMDESDEAFAAAREANEHCKNKFLEAQAAVLRAQVLSDEQHSPR